MDTAFETETKKLIKAWVIGKNTSYIQPEKDLFYANPDEIVNYDEVLKNNKLNKIEVRYKRGHLRDYGKFKSFVIPHFFILNKTGMGIVTLPESPEHKRIKSFIYSFFFNNPKLELSYSKYKRKEETIYQKIKLSDLPIEWEKFSIKKEDFFEIGLTDTFNTRRVDVFLKFENFHPLFGEGLVIEVQLSPQSDEKTKDRTLDRALKGYSCIWINKKHFENYKAEELILKNKLVKIESWHSVIKNSSDVISDKIYDKIKKYSRLFDIKVEATLKKVTKSIFLQEGMLCPDCKIGQLTIRTAATPFLGCSSFPVCKRTYKLTINEGIKNEE